MPALLPLVDGERLTRAEFERRFDARPDTKVAELLDGIVRLTNDGRWVPAECRGDLAWLFGHYAAFTRPVSAGTHPSVRLDDRNEPQPDVALIVRQADGGRTAVDADGCLASAPELAAYVVMPEQPHLGGARRRVYQRFGTTELLFWRAHDLAIDWFVSRNGRFDRLPPDPVDGLLKSETFPGLWLDPAALVRRDLQAVLAALTRGPASPEHAAFAARLAAAAARA